MFHNNTSCHRQECKGSWQPYQHLTAHAHQCDRRCNHKAELAKKLPTFHNISRMFHGYKAVRVPYNSVSYVSLCLNSGHIHHSGLLRKFCSMSRQTLVHQLELFLYMSKLSTWGGGRILRPAPAQLSCWQYSSSSNSSTGFESTSDAVIKSMRPLNRLLTSST